MSNYSVSGVLVHAGMDNLEMVRNGLLSVYGAELHEVSDAGQLVVTLEGDNPSKIYEGIDRISKLDGVLSTSLVFQFTDDSEEDDYPEGNNSPDASDEEDLPS